MTRSHNRRVARKHVERYVDRMRKTTITDDYLTRCHRRLRLTSDKGHRSLTHLASRSISQNRSEKLLNSGGSFEHHATQHHERVASPTQFRWVSRASYRILGPQKRSVRRGDRRIRLGIPPALISNSQRIAKSLQDLRQRRNLIVVFVGKIMHFIDADVELTMHH